jgi:hypothetical protein
LWTADPKRLECGYQYHVFCIIKVFLVPYQKIQVWDTPMSLWSFQHLAEAQKQEKSERGLRPFL